MARRIELKRIENTNKFRQAALNFKKNGYYTVAPRGTTAWREYWDEEIKRCLYGYVAEDSSYITGYFYFYLNYCQIVQVIEREIVDERTGKIKRIASRESDFPLFYDYDKVFFDAVGEAEDLGKHLAVIKARRRGYLQPYSSKIKTSIGEITMGDVKLGDKILTPFGDETTVLEKYEHGLQDVYKINFMDGRTIMCGLDHLWFVYDRFARKNKVLRTIDLIKEIYREYKTHKHYRYFVHDIDAVLYSEKALSIHPYLFGCLLGDGSMSTNNIRISSVDVELLNRIRLILGDEYELMRDLSTACNYNITYRKARKAFKKINPLKNAIIQLGINKPCKEKFIPEIYKLSSYEQRLELIKGLMDTDGTISKDGFLEFSNSSERLIHDFVDVLRSMGIQCSIGNTKTKSGGGKINGRTIHGGDTYRVYIRTNLNLFHLNRKTDRVRNKRIRTKVAIVSIEKLDYKENSACILVDHSNHLYLTNDFIPTHNSWKCASMLCRNFYLIPDSKGYAIASESEFLIRDGLLTKAWAILDFVDEHTPWTKKRQKIDTKMHKRASFIVNRDGAKIEMGYKSEIMGLSLKGDVNKCRGKAARLVLFEEAGDFPNFKDAYQIIRPSVEQDARTYGTIISFGCVCAGTKVWTNDGNLVNIENLVREEGILGFDGKTISKENITYWQRPIKKPCYRITTNAGRFIECSEDHPIYTYIGQRYPKKVRQHKYREQGLGRELRRQVSCYSFKEVKDIVIGNRICVVDEVSVFGNKVMWEPRLIGWLIGDGSYGIDKTPRLFNCESEINEYIIDNFDTAVETAYITKTGKEYFATRIKGICGKLREIGIYGQTKLAKTLPKDIHSYRKEDLVEFIGGLFDTDGYVYRNQVSISSMSNTLLLEIKFLLQKFGIYCIIHRIKKSIKNPKDKNDYYRLTISDKRSVLKFADNITLFPKVKTERLSQVYKHFEDKKEKIDKNAIGFRIERVVNIDYIGIKDVYNLTANNTHTYIANGIITKNTGGSKEGNYEGLKDIFYEPKGYNCLAFDNIWDEGNMDRPCGLFVPQYVNMTGDEGEGLRFMDEDGNSLIKEATKYCLEKRDEIIANASDKFTIDRYIAEHCMTPIEACLVLSGNIFPKKELINHLARIRNTESMRNFKQVGELIFDSNGKVHWEINPKLKDHVRYRLDPGVDRSGAIVIWEHPVDDPPYGLYIAATDPYDHDVSTTTSLGSCFIYKRFQNFESYYDLPVAEYTGRPDTADEYYENVRKLLFYYNAKLLYENEKKGIYAYFSHKHCEYLLADQPDIIKDIIKDSRVQRTKGIHMTNAIKDWGEIRLKDWLNEEYAPGQKNLTKIFSEPLLEELISYNRDGNYDRVIAMILIMIYKEELYHLNVKKKEQTEKSNLIFPDGLFVWNNERFII